MPAAPANRPLARFERLERRIAWVADGVARGGYPLGIRRRARWHSICSPMSRVGRPAGLGPRGGARHRGLPWHGLIAKPVCRLRESRSGSLTRTSRSASHPAVPTLVVVESGRAVWLNRSARALVGQGVGRPCWRLLGGLEEVQGLPCTRGCARELIGRRRARRTPIRLRGRPTTLTCVPTGGLAVCMLGGRSRSRAVEPILTPREIDVVRLLAEGARTGDIAQRLRLAAGTVRTHVENIRGKLGAATRAGLVARAFRLGLID